MNIATLLVCAVAAVGLSGLVRTRPDRRVTLRIGHPPTT